MAANQQKPFAELLEERCENCGFPTSVTQGCEPTRSAKYREFAASAWECGKVAVAESMELPEEQPDAHLDIAIDFRLASRSGHEVSTGQAFVESNTANVDLFTFS